MGERLMSNTRHIPEDIDLGNGSRQFYCIRLMVKQPHAIADQQFFTARNHDQAQRHPRMSEAIARASYMVNGPNREVLWSLECANKKRRVWETVIQGKSVYPKNGPRP